MAETLEIRKYFESAKWATLSPGEGAGLKVGGKSTYVKLGVARPVVIPAYREVPVFVIRNNLKTAGLSRDEYFKLLEENR